MGYRLTVPDGKLRSVTIGRSRRVVEADLRTFMAGQGPQSPTEAVVDSAALILLSPIEVAALLSVSRSTVYSVLLPQALPSIGLGSYRRIRAADLVRFVAKGGTR